jgi:hypothetical protein
MWILYSTRHDTESDIYQEQHIFMARDMLSRQLPNAWIDRQQKSHICPHATCWFAAHYYSPIFIASPKSTFQLQQLPLLTSNHHITASDICCEQTTMTTWRAPVLGVPVQWQHCPMSIDKPRVIFSELITVSVENSKMLVASNTSCHIILSHVLGCLPTVD